MKNLFLITMLSFLSIALMAQHQHIGELNCSKALFAKEYYKNYSEIEQTHLLFNYDIKFYFLDLYVENNSIDISGKVTYNAQVVVEQTDTFAFELVNELNIDSVLINDINQYFIHTNNEVFVPLPNTLGINENFTAQIFYHGTPPTGGFFTGISTAYDSTWNKHVTWTLSEPFNARQWWPVKQVLSDKADSVWVYITTSDINKVGSQGLLTNISSMPDNKVRYEWKSKYPIEYYLISFAVAEYQDYSIYAHPAAMMGDSLLIQNYMYDSPGCLENNKIDIDRCVQYIELFSNFYSLYPFSEEKYGHCYTAMGGGMEHQTMTSMGYFGFGIVAHELGHMWFGDNVTCATWSDIWINEGFATYTDFLAHEYIAAPQFRQIWLNNAHNYVLTEPYGSVYVPPEEITYDNVERIFDGRLSYFKGSLIIHMIRYELQNDDIFFEVLQNFQQEFSDSTATGLDFMHVLNETSGMDFTDFFNQWYFGEGYPIYNITWVQENDNLQIISLQTSSMPQVTPFFKMHMPYKIFFNDGTDTTLKLLQEFNDMEYNLPFEITIDSIQLDPELWVLKEGILYEQY